MHQSVISWINKETLLTPTYANEMTLGRRCRHRKCWFKTNSNYSTAIDTYLLTSTKPSSCSYWWSCILPWVYNNSIEPAIVLLSKNVNYFAISFGLTDPYFDICNGIWDMNTGMLLLLGKYIECYNRLYASCAILIHYRYIFKRLLSSKMVFRYQIVTLYYLLARP